VGKGNHVRAFVIAIRVKVCAEPVGVALERVKHGGFDSPGAAMDNFERWMAAPDELADRLVEFRQRLMDGLAMVGEIDHQRLARCRRDHVGVAFRTHVRRAKSS
jgi:hypothetical protein